MRHLTRQDVKIQRLLRSTRTIAVVGPSRRVQARSYQIMSYLRKAGYDVVPIRRDCGASPA
jgi:predicted CoA-binding protein